jgi:hypothetical protein
LVEFDLEPAFLAEARGEDLNSEPVRGADGQDDECDNRPPPPRDSTIFVGLASEHKYKDVAEGKNEGYGVQQWLIVEEPELPVWLVPIFSNPALKSAESNGGEDWPRISCDPVGQCGS